MHKRAVQSGVRTAVLLIAGYLLFRLVFGDPFVLYNNRRLQQRILEATEGDVVLQQLTPFEWDAVYTFSPYTSKEEIFRHIGFSSISVQETVSEGMTQLLFVDDRRVVCSVCAYPSNAGYIVSGLPCGQAVQNESNAPKFHLERRGEIIWLQYLPG